MVGPLESTEAAYCGSWCLESAYTASPAHAFDHRVEVLEIAGVDYTSLEFLRSLFVILRAALH